jgi:hypothetical protein
MFGFGKKPDHFVDLLEHLVENWGMRSRFASSFLSEYRTSISKLHEEGTKRLDQLRQHGSAEQRLIAIASEPKDYALVGQAYQAYLGDLRHGKHVDSDIELAIWGILVNRIDLLETIDRGLAGFIESTHSERFPDLFEKVFDD